ncbi:nitrate- and nitrite sensing domain-containing protein [uncultured Roseibium sp.]|uniref:methyl-accepting chemotaxis protein n=1 Tax=uncultured Roseibium sp. TaxID=1936171 RepID=UPI003217C105
MLKSVRVQIALLAVIPLLAVLIVNVLSLSRAYKEALHASDLRPIAEAARLSEGVLNELQKERGRTAVLLASDHAAGPRELVDDQRQLSDAVIADFVAFGKKLNLDNQMMQAAIGHAIEGLAEIKAHRSEVDGKTATAADNLAFYSGKIRMLLTVVHDAVQASPDPEYAAEMVPFALLTDAKEAGGLERAIGGKLFTLAALKGTVEMPLFLAYFDRLAVETDRLKAFRDVARPEQTALFDRLVSGPAVDQVMDWRKVLRDLPSTGDGRGIDGSVWFAKATERLNKIREVSLDFAGKAEARVRQLESQAWRNVLAIVTASTIVFLMTVGISIWQIRNIVNALRAIRDSLTRIAHSDTDFEMPMVERSDVIGDLARAGVIFQDNARARVALEEDAVEERSRESSRQNHVEKIILNFRDLIDDVNGKVNDKTEAMMRIAARVLEIASSATTSAEEAKSSSAASSTSVQTVASAAEEMSSAIGEILSQSGRASEIIDTATAVARDTDANVSSLANAAQKIGTVVEMIRDIAEQTNLLALNATIEAARAGEAGKGFAVVAAEVKELSNQTAKATEEIASQIDAVQGLTDGAVNSIREITDSISNIMDVTTAITAAVEQQSIATKEISQSITIAADGSAQAVEGAAQVSRSIHETAEEAKTVDSISCEVKAIATELSNAVDDFLKEMRADVTERRKALRKQVNGEPVTVKTAGGEFESALFDASDNGLGARSVPGVKVGDRVTVEREDGASEQWVVVWIRNMRMGLHAASRYESVAA